MWSVEKKHRWLLELSFALVQYTRPRDDARTNGAPVFGCGVACLVMDGNRQYLQVCGKTFRHVLYCIFGMWAARLCGGFCCRRAAIHRYPVQARTVLSKVHDACTCSCWT